jgi:hypothetical protein
MKIAFIVACGIPFAIVGYVFGFLMGHGRACRLYADALQRIGKARAK